ncbi:glycosyltransferase family 2 protein [Rubinisphaera sp. JC750]|uniref:glycosyltransferase family 2 protein n=1 Tax=Rubinisphaera sp. JC750 TaxID=2898658 RepID=UPI001F2CCA41|nr:glycosyltransferase [Rubinisphaera sp. JC750]
MKQVSILIPCYNAERYVGEAIESALSQKGESIEVIVVDDGSTDNSVNVLRSFGDRIRWETGPNKGACAARNRAFELSTGEFIQFLDADDKLAPNKIERQLPLLLGDVADVVLCKLGLFGDERGERPEKRPHPHPEGDPFLYFAEFGIQTAAPLHRRIFVERSEGFLNGLKRGQEADFHLRLAALKPRIAMIDDILVWVRMHQGERISSRPLEINQVVSSQCRMADFLDSHGLWTPARRSLVSQRLLNASRKCFVEGQSDVAVEGIRKAIDIDSEVTSRDRTSRKLLYHALGPALAEHLICQKHFLMNLSKRPFQMGQHNGPR